MPEDEGSRATSSTRPATENTASTPKLPAEFRVGTQNVDTTIHEGDSEAVKKLKAAINKVKGL